MGGEREGGVERGGAVADDAVEGGQGTGLGGADQIGEGGVGGEGGGAQLGVVAGDAPGTGGIVTCGEVEVDHREVAAMGAGHDQGFRAAGDRGAGNRRMAPVAVAAEDDIDAGQRGDGEAGVLGPGVGCGVGR